MAPGGDTVEITPEAENKFYIKGPEISIEFLTENNSQVMLVGIHGGQKFIKTP